MLGKMNLSEYTNNWSRCLNKETSFFNLDIFNWYLPIMRYGTEKHFEDMGVGKLLEIMTRIIVQNEYTK